MSIGRWDVGVHVATHRLGAVKLTHRRAAHLAVTAGLAHADERDAWLDALAALDSHPAGVGQVVTAMARDIY